MEEDYYDGSGDSGEFYPDSSGGYNPDSNGGDSNDGDPYDNGSGSGDELPQVSPAILISNH